METSRKVALSNEILRGTVGSKAHGTNIDNLDDRDEMLVFVENSWNVCGLHPVDHYIYRDAADGERSKPGDLDLSCYSLRKFCKLGVKGNPHTLNLLWLPEYITKIDPIAGMLLDIRECFISKNAANAYLGYLHSQKMKLQGERSPKVSRPELVEKYGFDTKFAAHAVRLGFQGIELITEGKITLPMKEEERDFIIKVRTGGYSFESVLGLIEKLEKVLRNAADKFTKEPEEDKIDDFLCRAHQHFWAW